MTNNTCGWDVLAMPELSGCSTPLDSEQEGLDDEVSIANLVNSSVGQLVYLSVNLLLIKEF